jgi:hypothetical protein
MNNYSFIAKKKGSVYINCPGKSKINLLWYKLPVAANGKDQ